MGTSSGAGASMVSHPFDTVRARIQNTVGQKVSAVDVVKNMYKEEGLIAFMKGVIPNMARAIPSAAVGYALYRKILPWVTSRAMWPARAKLAIRFRARQRRHTSPMPTIAVPPARSFSPRQTCFHAFHAI